MDFHEQIINLLKAEKPYLAREFGVISIGLFGSFARGRPDHGRDIDLIVELKEPRFDYLAGLQAIQRIPNTNPSVTSVCFAQRNPCRKSGLKAQGIRQR
ncbi:MAG: nucleotidyltransferase domain-containing protein [Deltaproteobacteria bacterium]|nr:nucleotidyltransferase domain-containing protein [Deltaproteobacteria bacterium]